MLKKIVMTKTPLRVSFLGGGTDISNFFKKKSGIVVSCSINKFIYVTIKEHGSLFFSNYRLNYSKTENKNKLNSIQNDIIRETLKIIKIKRPLYVSSISDIPSNSGLGSSSAFTVGLIKALYEFENKKISNIEAAELACKIEIERVKSPIGKQDQYATAIGGFNSLHFNKNSKVSIKKIKKEKVIKNIFENSVFIWLGTTRKTNKILKDQNKRLNKNIESLEFIKNFAIKLCLEIKQNKFSINKFGNLIDKSWQLKKRLSKKIENNKIMKLYDSAIQCGSLGGKLLGAGGGGFLFFVVKKKNIPSFKKKISLKYKKIKFVDFNYYKKGSEILISQ